MEKKIIYVLNYYSEDSTQHFYHIQNLLVEMANNGVKIALVIEKSNGIPNIIHPNITIFCQKQKNNFKRSVELITILKNLIKQGYNKIFVRISINAAILSIIAGKLFKGKVYYWQSGTTLEVDSQKEGLKKIKWLMYDFSRLWFVKSCVYRFVTGPEFMVDYYSKNLKINKERMMMLYNDIDLSRFKVHSNIEKKELRKNLGIDENDYIILMVHRLSPVRKTDLYIPKILESKFWENKKVKLLIIGDGPERELLEKLTKESSARKRILFLGVKANRELQEYYAIADLFINPSYTEGFPRVVIEAMASGLPIVATNAGGTKDLFGAIQKNYIVDRTDMEVFSKKMQELYISSEKAKKCREENLERSRKYSTQAVALQYEKKIFTYE